jgi:hypothetical protein
MRQPTPEQPFTLDSLKDDDVTRAIDKLAEALMCRAGYDCFGAELPNHLLKVLEDDIRDELVEAVLRYRTSTVVVDGYAEMRGVRA